MRFFYFAVFVLLFPLSMVACDAQKHDAHSGHHDSQHQADAVHSEHGTARSQNVDLGAYLSEQLQTNQSWMSVPLTTHAGESQTWSQLVTGPTLLSTFYTRCPDPDMCPRTVAHMRAAWNAIPENQRDSVSLVLVSLDPQYDSLEVLNTFAKKFNMDDLKGVQFVTGDAKTIAQLLRTLGTGHGPSMVGMEHSMLTYVLQDEKTVAKVYKGNQWPVDEVAQSLFARSHPSE